MNSCTLCDQSGGAVVKCSDCPAEYHVSCAWKAGHKFGFEIQPVKASRRDLVTVIEFKEVTGQMIPQVTCKGHPSHRRETLDLCETNEVGETAMQVYCKNYKQAPTANTHGLLRKAKRLDRILNTDESDADSSSPTTDPKCWKCKTEFSPQFHHDPNAANDEDSDDDKDSDDEDKDDGDHEEAKEKVSWLCHGCFCTHGLTAKKPVRQQYYNRFNNTYYINGSWRFCK